MSNSNPAGRSILHVVDSLEYGGLERFVVDLAARQKANGDQVAIFSILNTGGYLDEARAAGLPVFQGGKTRSFDLSVLRQLRSTALTARADVVHAHNFTPNYYSATALLATGARRPTLVGTCHDMGDRLTNQHLRRMYRWSLKRTAAVSMVSRGVYDQYKTTELLGTGQARVILNGVPVERFSNSPARRAEARARLGIAPERLVVGTVGRLVQLKNHRMLIALVPELVRTFPDLLVVIVGYGPLEDALRRQIDELGIGQHVSLTGKRTDVSDILPAFDVYCVSSTTEGLPISLLEACASSLPVVSTAVGGNAEVIEDGHTGLLTPSEDQGAMREALARLLGSPAERQQMAQAARNWVEANASMDSLYRAYEAFYREAGERGR